MKIESAKKGAKSMDKNRSSCVSMRTPHRNCQYRANSAASHTGQRLSTGFLLSSTCSYHANFATKPLGHFLTINFLASSSSKTPMPKAAGRKKCSAGTPEVANTFCSCGM